MHDRIFANQRELDPSTFVGYARELGLDVAKFERDVASPELKARIQRDVDEAGALGVTGTPAFFINGRHLSGAQPFPAFKRMIDAELGSS